MELSDGPQRGTELLGDVLVALKQRNSPDGFLVPITYMELLRITLDTANELGAKALHVTPHCFRHGGATHDQATGARSLAEIQARGFWRAASSVRRYSKHGRLALQLQTLGPRLVGHFEREAQLLSSACARLCGLPCDRAGMATSGASSSSSQVRVLSAASCAGGARRSSSSTTGGATTWT